jgi:hypothetical protein
MRLRLLSGLFLLATLAVPIAAQGLAGWRFTPPGESVTIDRTTRHGGAASASLQGTGATVSLRQSVQPDAYRGRRVRYSASVRTDSVNLDFELPPPPR